MLLGIKTLVLLVAGLGASAQHCGADRLVGCPAPDFHATAVLNRQFVDVKLSDYRGKYVVLFFYPLDFTFVCPTEVTSFSDQHREFAALGAEILGVSVDSQFAHLAWINTDRNKGGVGDLEYALVADVKHEIVRSYHVEGDDGAALRGLFVIDPDGVIQHATVNNAPIGRNVAEALRTLQAVKYVRENPEEVCPAGWTPGARTMKPNPVDSQEFFAGL